MLVLKFGGTSVGSAENIEKVITIVKERLKEGRLLVVVSAMGGTTDALLECGKLAAAGNETYKEKLREIEQRHISTVNGIDTCTATECLTKFGKKNVQ
jgi:aspartokinase/homoserine dehydrogenase 1